MGSELRASDVRVIEADHAEREYWKDLWRYRELLGFLAWRDVLVRYKQTALGVAWAVLRPLSAMVVLTFVFGRVAGLSTEGRPYALLVFSGLLAWQFVSAAMSAASTSLLTDAHIVSKVWFPRLIVPVSAVIVCLVDLAIALVLFGLLMVAYGQFPGARVVLLPVFLLIGGVAATGVGVGFAALAVRYRDFRYVVPFVEQLGLYASPVAYASDLVPEGWRVAFHLNPMAGVIDGVRWATLPGAETLDWAGVGLAAVISITLLAAGIWYFRRVERMMADVI